MGSLNARGGNTHTAGCAGFMIIWIYWFFFVESLSILSLILISV